MGRLILSLGGVANSIDKFLSMTVLMLLGLIFYGVTVHTSGFGSYKQLLPVYFIGWFVAEVIVISGIVISILSGKDNIFSAPEYSPNKADGRTWAHAVSHAVVIVVAPLISWLIGSLIMFITKRISGAGQPKASTAS